MTSELAYNLNGEPFDVPAQATGWRVRKMKHKGAPEVVYGRNGMPLVLPIEADLDDVRAETTSPGRYRLDPVDDTNRPIADAPVGYVYVHDQPRNAVESIAKPMMTIAPLPTASDNIVIEAMRMNAEIAKAVVCTFPQMLESASTLLRAADGAGLPARMPSIAPIEDEEDDDDEEVTSPAGFDFGAMLQQLAPLIGAALASGKLKIPGLGEMFDWRKAAPKTEAPAARKHAPTESQPSAHAHDDMAEDPKVAEPMIPPLDPATIVHFLAIQKALAPNEAALARAVASELGAADLRAWFDELKKLSVPEAVAKIRAQIGKTGGVS